MTGVMVLALIASRDAVVRILTERKKAAEVEDRTPKKFRFNYSDDADPGYRVWTRSGNEWEEKHPSGRIKRFQTIGRDVVEDRPGTVIRNLDETGFKVFVSDKGVETPQTYFHRDGDWTLLGPMEDVE